MRVATPIKPNHLAVGLTLVIVLSLSGFLSLNVLAQPGVWEDLFDDTTKISQQNNVVVAGGDVTLDAGNWDWFRHGILLDVGPPGSTYISSSYPEVLEGSDGTWRMWYTGKGTGFPSMRYIRYATSVDGRNWDRQGIVIGPNASQEDRVYAATVIEDGGIYKMWYVGDDFSAGGARIFYATSPSGHVWTRQGLVINKGFQAPYDNNGAVFPEVIKEGGVYRMWYAGYDGSNYRILYATSNDGIAWTSQGLAIDIGSPGDFDSSQAIEPTVTKDPLGIYHMWYSGSNALNWRIGNATSLGGVSWTKQGLSMDLLPNTPEDGHLFAGTVLINSNWVTTSWYGCVDSSNDGRICMATYARNGYVISEVIGPIAGYGWLEFFSNKTDVGPDVFVAYSILDGATGNLVMGYPQILTPQFSLASIDALTYPSIQMRGDLWDFQNNVASTPILHDYAVTWDDFMPPVFGGLVSAVDDGTDGDITLNWNPAWDPSPPIIYNIYIATMSGGQNFFVPDYSTPMTSFPVSGLQNGIRYYFVVRAEDSWGFEDSNMVERSAIPTTPIDNTAPSFGGLTSATDSATGGNITLGWTAAIDPDTPESNSDPSLPITYNIYYSETSGGQDFLLPNATTQNTNYEVMGLTNGNTYYFVVRSEDAVGNEESNLIEMSAIPTTPIDVTPPSFGGLATANDLGTGGKVRLTWTAAVDPDTPECNSDPSLPITYNIYYSKIPGGQDFLSPNATTTNTQFNVSFLDNGAFYYFVVRAEDSAGNEENNLVELSAIPTTPVDTTPPTFAGLQFAVDAGTGGVVTLDWTTATDPDTPECNTDPSLPISYDIFYSTVSGGQNFMSPNATTQLLTFDVTGLTNGIPYYFVVRARDSVLNQEFNTVERSAIPTTPVDDTAPSFGGITTAFDSQTDGNVTLMWSPASDPDTVHCNSDPSLPITYLVYVSTTSGGQNFLLPDTTTQLTQIEITGLQNGVTYYFVVRARDSPGNQETNVIEASAMPTTPVDDTAPTYAGIVVATDAGSGGAVDLFWAAATDPDTIECNSDPSLPITYFVFYSTTSGGQNFLTPDASTPNTTIQITGLQDGIDYYFVVRARDAANNWENNGVEKSAMPTTPLDDTPPQFAGLVTAVDLGTDGKVSLTWATATDPDTIECNTDPSTPIQYNIYYSTVSGGQDFLNPDATEANLQATISGLQNGVTYYFVVRAVDATGNEETNTIERSAMPTTPNDTTPPDFAGVISASDAETGGSVALTWSLATDPDTIECNSDPSLPIQYNVYVATVSGGQDFLTANQTSTGTQITIAGLQNGITYYFVVRAEDAAGNEDDNLIEMSVMPTTPIDTSPPGFGGLDQVTVDDDDGEITLIWVAGTDPDDPECNTDPSTPIVYNIYVSESPTTFDFIVPTATTGLTQYTFSGLERGVEYFFIVRAEDAAGNEEENTVTKSGQLAVLEEEFNFLDYWWIFLVIIIILLMVVIILLSRKKKGEEPTVEAEEEEVEEDAEEESPSKG